MENMYQQDSALDDPGRSYFRVTRPLFVSALFLIGLYAPTSMDGQFSDMLWAVYLGIAALFFASIVLSKEGIADAWTCVNSIVMVAVLIGATIVSPFPDYRWGGLLPFVCLALMFTLNIYKLDGGKLFRITFAMASLVNIVWGAAMVLGSDAVNNFVVAHYSAFYPELLGFMTDQRKPVLSFGTHSIAAFYLYLFFWLNFETAKATKRKFYFVLAICLLALTFAQLSVTGLILGAVAVFQLLQFESVKRPKLVTAIVCAVCLCGLFVIRRYDLSVEDWADATKSATDILSSPTSGFLGRFSQFGTLYSTVIYLKDRPFSPVGAGYRGDLFFGDCGPVEYYLRGSVILLVAIYWGLFAFLRRNLLSKADAMFLFIAIVAFELGQTCLAHFRTLYLLPAFVIYLNGLRRQTENAPGEISLALSEVPVS